MEETSQITEFGKTFLYFIGGTLLVLLTLFINKLIAPHKPNPIKESTYECGEVAQGSAWIQFNSRFYVIALVFLLFDVEIVFIFPWATIFGSSDLIEADGRWGWYTLTEMFIFVGILIVGLIYVWKNGDLEWIKPNPIKPSTKSSVPMDVYKGINNEIYQVKPATLRSSIDPDSSKEIKTASKPVFRPTFLKQQNS